MPLKNAVSAAEAVADLIQACPDSAPKITYDVTKNWKDDGPKYAPVESYPTFEDAADKLRAEITALAKDPPGEPIVVRATPGLGKTEAANHLARLLAVAGKRVMIGLPTREMARQVADRLRGAQYGQKVIVLEGRHGGYQRTIVDEAGRPRQVEVNANCYRHAAVERASSKGYAAGAYVCPKCPYWPWARKGDDDERVGFGGCCTYYEALAKAARWVPEDQQSGAWSPVIVTTHAGARAHAFEGNVEVDWVILDEDCSGALRTTQGWDENELARACETIPQLKRHRALLAETINIAQLILARFSMSSSDRLKVPPALNHLTTQEVHGLCQAMADSKYMNEWALTGKVLVRFLEAAARSLGQNDLEAVLHDAAASKSWVDRGELYEADDTEVNDLPHHLEPDLARELLKVVLEAKEERESAYAVSIRFSRYAGWAVMLDRLDPIEYEGQLVLLDAYADDELTRRYCGLDAPPMTIDARCRCRDNVKIKHYKIKTTRKILDDLEQRTELYDKFVWPELERFRGKKILFYTSKRYVDWLKKRVEAEYLDFEAVAFKYWWQDRGDDSYGDYDLMVAFGTPIPNIIGERHSANATFSGEETLSWRSNRDGRVDPRVKALEESRRDKELYQSAYRLRPASATGKDQTLVLLTDMPLPVLREMPGAKEEYEPKPTLDLQWVGEKLSDVFFWLDGCWSTAFAPFQYGLEDDFWKWGRDAIYAPMGEEPPIFMSYEKILERWKRIQGQEERRREQADMVRALGTPCAYVRTRAGSAPVWGNTFAGFRVIRALQIATRQPGEDQVGADCCFREPGKEGKLVALAKPLTSDEDWLPSQRAPPEVPDYAS